MRRPSGLWLVIGALALAWALLLVFGLERRTVRLPTGYKGEARENYYYAARRLLERAGVEVRSIRAMDELLPLPSAATTLVLATERRTLGSAVHEALHRWVEEGGHLVVATWTFWDDENRRIDPLLDPLDVRQFSNDCKEEDEDCEEPTTTPAKAVFPGAPEPLEVEFLSSWRAETSDPRAQWFVGDEAGDHLIQYALGKGRLTVLTDDFFMRNDRIAGRDHAEAFWRLVSPPGEGRAVWLVHAESYPSLLTLVLRSAWMLVASALALGALWLWRQLGRFGPVLPDPPRVRRELALHLEASGRLLWRCGEGARLLERSQENLREVLAQRHPAWGRLDPAPRNALLAERSGLSEAAVAEALSTRPPQGSESFTQRIASLERMRKVR